MKNLIALSFFLCVPFGLSAEMSPVVFFGPALTVTNVMTRSGDGPDIVSNVAVGGLAELFYTDGFGFYGSLVVGYPFTGNDSGTFGSVKTTTTAIPTDNGLVTQVSGGLAWDSGLGNSDNRIFWGVGVTSHLESLGTGDEINSWSSWILGPEAKLVYVHSLDKTWTLGCDLTGACLVAPVRYSRGGSDDRSSYLVGFSGTASIRVGCNL